MAKFYKYYHTSADTNLAPPATEWVDGYINSQTGELVPPSAVTQEKTSDYIPITGGGTYTYSHAGGFPTNAGGTAAWRAMEVYSSNKTYLGRRGTGDTTTPLTESLPSNAAYVRLSCSTHGVLDGYMFNTGTSALPYTDYYSWHEIAIYARDSNSWTTATAYEYNGGWQST